MNKIWLVIKREYLYRVRKKSFLIMTFLTPLLFGLFFFLPVWLVQKTANSESVIGVIDESGKIEFPQYDDIKLVKLSKDFEAKLSDYDAIKDYDGILVIPANPDESKLMFYSAKGVAADMKLDKIKEDIQSQIQKERMQKAGISAETLDEILKPVKIETYQITEKGNVKAGAEILTILATVGAIIIYLFIMIYGGSAMSGVMEEKTNRVVEILVSSIRPFELMIGKLVAIAFVALTQFAVWLIGAFLLYKYGSQMMLEQGTASKAVLVFSQVMDTIGHINITQWVLVFFFYFIFGYLLYASLFAAIGAAVDVQADAQQFTFPLTMPIIFTLVAMQPMIMQPDGQLAFWLSMIPFTAPIAMIIRVSFDNVVQTWELLLSMFLMLSFVLGTIWISAKVFRMGILFYGRKPTYRDLWKWIKY